MLSETEGIDKVTKEKYRDVIEDKKYFAISAIGRFAGADGTKEGCDLELQCQGKMRNYLISRGEEKDTEMVEATMRMNQGVREGTLNQSYELHR